MEQVSKNYALIKFKRFASPMAGHPTTCKPPRFKATILFENSDPVYQK
jgi:hypothetical protein